MAPFILSGPGVSRLCWESVLADFIQWGRNSQKSKNSFIPPYSVSVFKWWTNHDVACLFYQVISNVRCPKTVRTESHLLCKCSSDYTGGASEQFFSLPAGGAGESLAGGAPFKIKLWMNSKNEKMKQDVSSRMRSRAVKSKCVALNVALLRTAPLLVRKIDGLWLYAHAMTVI